MKAAYLTILDERGISTIYKLPIVPEIPPCWCKIWTFPETINLTDSANKTFKPRFCPECGRSLIAERKP